MAKRYRQQRTSPLEDMISLASRLPWWVCLLAGLLSFVLLHAIASQPLLPKQLAPGQMGDAMVNGIFRSMAMLGQFIIPGAFSFAAILSAVNAYRRKRDADFVPVPPDMATPSTDHTQTQLPGRSEEANGDCNGKPGADEIDMEVENPQSVATQQQWGLSVLQTIEWKRFEIVTREFLKMTGYEAHETHVGADGGVDIRVTKPGNDAFRGIVQCKAWNAYRVGVKTVRELYGVMAAENVKSGMVITSGSFTAEAEEFAEGKVKLISGENFLGRIRKMSVEKQEKLLAIALEGDYQTPTCPQCDIKMTLRASKQGRNRGDQFWGCVRYPRCRQTLMASQKVRPTSLR